MSWLFSQALVEVFSGANSSDGEPCAPLSVMPTPHKFWRNDKTMECSNLSQFGLTCAVLTEGHGAELLMSFLEASRARTSAPQGKVRASREPALVSGLNLLGSLARFNRATSSWKTPQCSLVEGLDEFSETWPRWGSMRNGVSWARKTPSGILAIRARITNEKGSGSSERWPTPRAQEANGGDYQYDRGDHSKPRLTLKGAVKRFPTPRAADGAHSGTNPTPTTLRRLESGQANLSEAVLETTRFPTPCARDYRSPNLKPYSERGGGGERRTACELRGPLSDTNSDEYEGQSHEGRRQGEGTGIQELRRRGWWAVEPALGRVAPRVAYRVDRIKAVGNGQVPAVVRLAFQTLYRRLIEN